MASPTPEGKFLVDILGNILKDKGYLRNGKLKNMLDLYGQRQSKDSMLRIKQAQAKQLLGRKDSITWQAFIFLLREILGVTFIRFTVDIAIDGIVTRHKLERNLVKPKEKEEEDGREILEDNEGGVKTPRDK